MIVEGLEKKIDTLTDALRDSTVAIVAAQLIAAHYSSPDYALRRKQLQDLADHIEDRGKAEDEARTAIRNAKAAKADPEKIESLRQLIIELEDWQEEMREEANKMADWLYPIWYWRARQPFISAAIDLTRAAEKARRNRDDRKPDFAKDFDAEDQEPRDPQPELIRIRESYEDRRRRSGF